MPRVKVNKDNFEAAIRKFRRLVDDEGIIQTVRQKQYYEKPCDKRNRKRSAAINRSKRSDS